MTEEGKGTHRARHQVLRAAERDFLQKTDIDQANITRAKEFHLLHHYALTIIVEVISTIQGQITCVT